MRSGDGNTFQVSHGNPMQGPVVFVCTEIDWIDGLDDVFPDAVVPNGSSSDHKGMIGGRIGGSPLKIGEFMQAGQA